jgi:hypothetical protein
LKTIILSTEIDSVSNKIIKWLNYYFPLIETKRYNNIEELNHSDFCTKNIYFIRTIRHYILENDINNLKNDSDPKKNILNTLESKTINEKSNLFKYVLDSKKFTIIGNRNYTFRSKLFQLETASEFDLNVPEWIYTDDLEKLKLFCNKQFNSIITKPIGEAFKFYYEGDIFASFTTRIDENLLSRLPKKFPISFFQKEIKKIFEIRTFHFYGTNYSMAIWSQDNSMTEVDFRNYDNKKPNRCVPFKLSNNLDSKINKMMKKLELNSGSLDFIYSSDGQIYFLEVNPDGQFGMVSQPCNYHLEEKIALKINHVYRKKQNKAL